ncbi:glycosyltransferase family 4 protein [uncultured Sphingomonas sp.]|uniref:glycosyltransferase family 4 protein n=1 Tax=uncultured Sphingomonas sp. TaxID=158754 RepID=UPI0025D36470|nr:glycosyltransferase family 4 protein [uncultured Sphingomonas sp.]
MKVLLVSETLETGGAETFVIRLANALAVRHQVIVAVMHGDRIQPQLAGQLDAQVRLERLRLPAERWLWRFDRLLRQARIDAAIIRSLQRRWLRGLIAREQPDVVHSHLLKADRLAAEARSAAPRRPRHVVTLHGDYRPYLQGHADPQMLHAERWIGRVLQSADAIVGVAREHVEHLSSVHPEARGKLQLIYNGYPEPRPASAIDPPLPTGKFVFGLVSRGVEQKGWALAVEAFAKLGRENAALVLVGEGPAIERLRRRSLQGVIFTGFAARPTDFIARFNVCLLPTLFPHESLPTAIIEYLAFGKPVIATDVGEIGTMLKAPGGRLAGCLLPFDGTSIQVAELIAAMRRLMDSPEDRAEMAQAASAAFERFAMPKCVAAYEQLYGVEDQAGALPVKPPARRSLL